MNNQLTDEQLVIAEFAGTVFDNTYQHDPWLRDTVADQDKLTSARLGFIMGYVTGQFPEILSKLEED